MMIDDDSFPLHPAAAHFGDEAAFPLAAFLSDACVCSRVQFVPESAGLWKLGKFRAVACGGCFFPRGNRAVLLDLLQTTEHWLIGKVVELFAAEIIVATLHVADGKPGAGSGFSEQCLLQKRDVLVEKLFLQIFRAGRNYHALTGANHWQQIGERLSSTCAGLDNQVALFFQRLPACLRHLQLSAPKFVGRMRTSEHSAGRKELIERTVLSGGRGVPGRWGRCGLRT